MSNDVLQNELTSCLTEVETVEREINAQLEVLGEKVDEGFSQMQKLSASMMQFATKAVKSPKFAKGLLYATAALSAITGAVENVKAAKAHNEALDKLMATKKKIAKEKIEQIKKIREIVNRVMDKLQKLVDNEASGTYDISDMDENVWSGKLSAMDKTMAIYRSTMYSKLLVDYLCAEYAAWMAGRQRSRLDRPTYYDCNRAIAKSLLMDKNSDADVERIFTSSESKIQGRDVYKVSDPQIFSTLLINYGLTEANKIRPLPKPEDSTLGEMVMENDLYKAYRDAWSWYRLADFFTSGRISFLLIVLVLFLNYLLFQWLDWAVWLEWIVGILIAIVGCGVVLVCQFFDVFTDWHDNWVRKIYEEAVSTQLEAAGYVEIYQPDLEKKNLVWEGVKGTLGGIASTFFN